MYAGAFHMKTELLSLIGGKVSILSRQTSCPSPAQLYKVSTRLFCNWYEKCDHFDHSGIGDCRSYIMQEIPLLWVQLLASQKGICTMELIISSLA
jgi:hypothetical protein